MHRFKIGGFSLEEELTRNWWRWAMLFWLCFALWFLFQRQANIHWMTLGDTDDNLRMAQVRAWLAGQSWYDLRQYRLAPALGGLDIHWSRIPDLPIAGLILALKPILGADLAERWAAGIAPLIPFAITITGVGLTVRRLIGPKAWPVGLLMLLCCASTITMYLPLRIDHHGWQLAALAITVAGLADPERARGGATVGLASAFSLAIGLELLPYCAMAGAIIALRWIWDAGEARRLAAYGLTLAGGSGLGFLLFASNGNYAMRCDALTPVWLSVMVAAGALVFLLARFVAANRWLRLVLGGAAGAGIVAFFILMFPQCLGRPEGVSDELANLWLNNVREARPIYRHKLDVALPMAALPILGILGAVLGCWRARGTPQFVGWCAVTLFTAFAGMMLLWQVRASPAAQLLSVAGTTLLAWVLIPWIMRSKYMLVRAFGSVAAFLIVSGLFSGLIIRFMPTPAQSATSKAVSAANRACGRLTTLRVLDRIPAATMFTHVDLGPRLIVTTHHNGIAGPYHRNEGPILDVHHAFGGSAANFREIAGKHAAAYLLTCPNMAETTLYRARNPDGFYAQLSKGQVPNWLEPVALPKGSPLRLWKIRYDLPLATSPIRPPAKP